MTLHKTANRLRNHHPCRYDHLTEVLNKILAERPENVIDFFEEYSRKVKEKRFRPMTDHLEDIYIPPEQYEMAKKLMTFLKVLHFVKQTLS